MNHMMSHIAKEQMQAYVLDMLADEAREQLEAHLLYCDVCLHEYTEAIAAHEHQLPDLPDDVPIAAQVIEAVRNDGVSNDVAGSDAAEPAAIEPVPMQSDATEPAAAEPAAAESTSTSKSVFNRSFAHYAIAATVTLMLMSTGVFQSLTGIASTVDAVNKEAPSLSEHIMERTLKWFDFNDGQEGE